MYSSEKYEYRSSLYKRLAVWKNSYLKEEDSLEKIVDKVWKTVKRLEMIYHLADPEELVVESVILSYDIRKRLHPVVEEVRKMVKDRDTELDTTCCW
jgi:hypothetical protein